MADEPRIDICEGGQWAGSGVVYRDDEGGLHIDQCAADLGEDVYDTIDEALTAGLASVTVGETTYTWTVSDGAEDQ